MVETNRSTIPLLLFNGENYDFWSIKMRTYFRSQNLWKVVEDRLTVPDDTSTLTAAQKKALDESIQKDFQARNFSANHGATTANEAWDTLQEEFQGSKKVCAVKLQSFRRDLENLKMKDNETAKDYYSRIKELVNQMRAYGENITDKKIVEKILISCTEKYDSVISTIEECKDIETLTPTELMGSLEAHEKRINRRNENTNESTFPSKINMYNHMTKDETIFCNIDKIKTKVKIGNGEFVEAIGKGTIGVDTNKKGKGMYAKKKHRQPFPYGKAWRAKKPLELVHTDVCGPIRTPSNYQKRYFILFIDDYTRMTWLCEDKGVQHQLTIGYAPEKNGVFERKNRTVMETARAMLMEKGLPKTFWAEAVYTAVYLLNRCPTNVVKDKTLVEAWSGRKPSAKHLRVFDCICYAHIPVKEKEQAG
ncbi:hypothetical protein UlMin_027094 [Ulmus minor]